MNESLEKDVLQFSKVTTKGCEASTRRVNLAGRGTMVDIEISSEMKSFKLCNVSVHNESLPRDWQTDWDACVLCQEETSEDLTHPGRSLKADKSVGYSKLAENLEEFQKLGQVPLGVNVSALDVGAGLKETLIAREAKWHKSCYLKFSTSKLERAKKRPSTDPIPTTSPVKTRRSKESFCPDACLFCSLAGTRSNGLSKVCTMHCSEDIFEAAKRMKDTQMLAKIAGAGDLVALEALYHNRCRAKYINRVKRATSLDKTAASLVALLLLDELVDLYAQQRRICIDIAIEIRLARTRRLPTTVGSDRARAHGIALAGLIMYLGPEKSESLLGFYAFSGCDTVSYFKGIGKLTAVNAWLKYPGATDGFEALQDGTVVQAMGDLKVFVVSTYTGTASCETVNECRRVLFTKSDRQLESIPPTRDALEQHAERAFIQSRVWRQSLEREQNFPDPADFGWKKCEEGWEPVWRTIPVASEACEALIECFCQKGCVPAHCKCLKNENI
ncbi:unnamed protein product [Phaedon cochleariae]|uniref:Uncharacterized protein n=1 Tax=Phaedon cochleariae TaxID=80249 RepID=A0A9N9SJ71_PHACE|nr:unnamed protein product [Phaedon cochleariae]